MARVSRRDSKNHFGKITLVPQAKNSSNRKKDGDVGREITSVWGITVLIIAIKYEETDLSKVEDFIYKIDNAYVNEGVIKMEQDILSTLNYFFAVIAYWIFYIFNMVFLLIKNIIWSD